MSEYNSSAHHPDPKNKSVLLSTIPILSSQTLSDDQHGILDFLFPEPDINSSGGDHGILDNNVGNTDDSNRDSGGNAVSKISSAPHTPCTKYQRILRIVVKILLAMAIVGMLVKHIPVVNIICTPVANYIGFTTLCCIVLSIIIIGRI